ncbi:MAG: hypothetical protein U1F65_03115 [Verrucomicrobiota bacterium]
MKHIKLIALLVCASSLLLTGCKTCNKCCSDTKPACGHKCCAEGHTDCAHCATCTKH